MTVEVLTQEDLDEALDERIDTDAIAAKVADSLDVEALLRGIDLTENVEDPEALFDSIDVNDKVDVHELLRHVNLTEWIDHDDVARGLDLETRVESEVYDLLGSYNPHTSCGTGSAFTSAVAAAIKYVVTDDDVLGALADALAEREVAKPSDPSVVDRVKGEVSKWTGRLRAAVQAASQ